MMKIPTYTNEELLDRMWAKEDIIQTMNRHCYYQSNGERAKEIDTLWVNKPENAEKASYGFNNGYYVGIDAIRRFYVDDYNGYRGDGVGYAEYHSAASPLVVVADDGQSARYLGFHFSYACKAEADGTGAAYQTTGLTFADLLLEDGVWKILNLVEESDHTIETGRTTLRLSRAVLTPLTRSTTDTKIPLSAVLFTTRCSDGNTCTQTCPSPMRPTSPKTATVLKAS